AQGVALERGRVVPVGQHGDDLGPDEQEQLPDAVYADPVAAVVAVVEGGVERPVQADRAVGGNARTAGPELVVDHGGGLPDSVQALPRCWGRRAAFLRTLLALSVV